jgi:hypothetical protein
MSLYSSSYLKNLASSRPIQAKTKLFTESRKIETGFDVFLSHSFLDKEEVEGLYIELTDFGLKVYVDWIVDPQLDRNNVTKESAALIRNRMNTSKSLLLAISTNASTSKWMPWELGYMDAKTTKCAIVPVSNAAILPKSYKGVEYLSLYPFIKKLPTDLKVDKLWIIEESNKYIVFDDWFYKNQKPFIRNTNIY